MASPLNLKLTPGSSPSLPGLSTTGRMERPVVFFIDELVKAFFFSGFKPMHELYRVKVCVNVVGYSVHSCFTGSVMLC